MKKNPDSIRSPAGLEWAILKRLPRVTLGLFALLMLGWFAVNQWAWEGSAREAAASLRQAEFFLLGLGIFCLTMLFTVLIGCVVVWIMKGPQYTADSVPMVDSDRPG